MNTTFTTLALASVIAVSALAGPVGATTDGETIANLKPRQGISLDVGSKRAVGYFLTDSRICNLTLLVAEALVDGDDQILAPTRLQFEVAAGSDVRVDTTDGRALAFGCATDAASMTVKLQSQVAAYSAKG